MFASDEPHMFKRDLVHTGCARAQLLTGWASLPANTMIGVTIAASPMSQRYAASRTRLQTWARQAILAYHQDDPARAMVGLGTCCWMPIS